MTENKLPEISFVGSVEKPVDKKRRIYLPSMFTNQLTQRIFHVTRGEDSNLYIYPSEIFIAKAARLTRSYGFRGQPDKDKRVYFQETMADAHPIKCDEQSRICIPQEFLDFANIIEKVLIIGAFDKLILWNPDAFHAFKQSSDLSEEERVHQFGWGAEPGHNEPV